MDPLNEVSKKIILLGDEAVGKTSLIRRLVVDQFNDKYISTIGTKVTAKKIQINMKEIMTHLTLQIWDILGQKGYTKLHNSSFRGTNGVLMVADITRKDTLKSLENYWIPTVENIVGSIPIIILANKSDLIKKAEFKEKELRSFANKFKAPFFLTSAKNGGNVSSAFYVLGERMLEFKGTEQNKPRKTKYINIQISEISTLIDRIIDDFCTEYGKLEAAMPVLRRQFEIVQLDLNNPTIEALRLAIERLALVEKDFREWEVAEANRAKRLKWVKELRMEK
jgi:small GTP-binding protein